MAEYWTDNLKICGSNPNEGNFIFLCMLYCTTTHVKVGDLALANLFLLLATHFNIPYSLPRLA
jgi:hypothetical protein